MATYLIRESRLFAKYDGCTAVSMTGQVTAYGSITGVAATDVITITGLTAVNGMGITLTSLTGGSGLSTGVKYYLVNSSGSTAKLALSQGGAAIDFTTDITAGTLLIQTDELMVWSSEFRDIFSAGTVAQAVTNSAGNSSGTIAGAASAITFPTVSLVAVASAASLQATVASSTSDEIAHQPLRQTFLTRTYWKFTMSTAPTTLYAEVLEGDIISNTAPNTP